MQQPVAQPGDVEGNERGQRHNDNSHHQRENLVGARRCLALGDPTGRPYDRLDPVRPYDRRDEAISTPCQGFDEPWIVGRIAQRLAQFRHGGIHAVVEVHEGILRPQLLLQFLARHDLARMLQQHLEHLKGLLLQPDLEAALAQFACAQVNFKNPEAHEVKGWGRALHGGAILRLAWRRDSRGRRQPLQLTERVSLLCNSASANRQLGSHGNCLGISLFPGV